MIISNILVYIQTIVQLILFLGLKAINSSMQDIKKRMRTIGHLYSKTLQTTSCQLTMKINYSSNFLDITIYNKLTDQFFNEKYFFTEQPKPQQGFFKGLLNKSVTQQKKIRFLDIYEDFKKLCNNKQLEQGELPLEYYFGNIIKHQSLSLIIFQDGQFRMCWEISNQQPQMMVFKLGINSQKNYEAEAIRVQTKMHEKQMAYQNQIKLLSQQAQHSNEVKEELKRQLRRLKQIISKQAQIKETTIVDAQSQTDQIQSIQTIQRESQTQQQKLTLSIIESQYKMAEKYEFEVKEVGKSLQILQKAKDKTQIKGEEYQTNNILHKQSPQTLKDWIEEKYAGKKQNQIISLLNSELNEINCNPIDQSCSQFPNFFIKTNQITKIKGISNCQLLMKPQIQPVGIFTFRFHILKQINGSILIGIVDRDRQKDQMESRLSENSLGYSGNGYMYPHKHQIGKGFKETQIVETIINRTKGTICWKVDDVIMAQTSKSSILKNGRILVPYIEMGSLNNCIRWKGCQYKVENE